ncbi:hypothetical protein HGRIS_014831 [Hohenbuehelia grisea]|uniref:CxC2-like cysteine cluster KDZ transposase-associated domain-containing protein n=1 Tax=Hohenbuehelia grisea TaxID=104357 RepID=A0ABR3IQV7_9AGAR
MQTLQGKINMYNYFGAIEKLTDNTGLLSPPDRYREFVRMVREYRHGAAYNPSGVKGATKGAFAVQCPACPKPGVNLPEDWENAPPDKKFLYTLFIALDACFRLKRRIISSEKKDPENLFAKRLKLAIDEREIQQESFAIFSAKQGDRVDGWREMVEAFEKDPTQPNPYEVLSSGLTEQDVRLQFAKEEAKDAANGVAALHETTPSGFIVLGLEIEDQQRRIKAHIKAKKAGTASQQLNVVEMRAKVSRSLAKFRSLQAVYMPLVLAILTNRVVPEGKDAEDVPLYLPSVLTKDDRSAQCQDGLADVERQFRDAQCRTAIDNLQTQLFVKSRLWGYKDRNARHQGMNTRALALINQNEAKIRLHCSKYRSSRAALLSLSDTASPTNGPDRPVSGGSATHDAAGTLASSPPTIRWPELRQEDVCCMEDPDSLTKCHVRRLRRVEQSREDTIMEDANDDTADDADESNVPVVAREGYRTISWIWMDAVKADLTTGTEMSPVLRAEWAKAWARVRRWTEEVLLVKEEMRRTVVSFRFLSRLWLERAKQAVNAGVRSEITMGMSAYAYRQGLLRLNMAADFSMAWQSGSNGEDYTAHSARNTAGDEDSSDEEEETVDVLTDNEEDA